LRDGEGNFRSSRGCRELGVIVPRSLEMEINRKGGRLSEIETRSRFEEFEDSQQRLFCYLVLERRSFEHSKDL